MPPRPKFVVDFRTKETIQPARVICIAAMVELAGLAIQLGIGRCEVGYWQIDCLVVAAVQVLSDHSDAENGGW